MRAPTFGIVAIATIAGCAVHADDDKPAQIAGPAADHPHSTSVGHHDDAPPPVDPGLILRVVGGDGDAPITPVPWPDKLGPFIRLFGTATTADVVDASYVFRVLDLDDALVSSDLEACRRFHVNQFGRIDAVLEGTNELGQPCEHATGIADNLLPVIQLFPFADAPVDPDGIMHFIVEIAPDGRFGGDYVLRAAFDVVASDAPPPPECDSHPDCPQPPDCPL